MKRPMGATVAVAVSCLSGLVATGIADAQVLSTMPPPTFGGRLMALQRGGRIVRAADHRGADQRRHRRPVREHATAPDVPQPIRQPHRGAVHAARRAWNEGRRVRVLERRAEDRRRGVRARRRATGVPERDPAPPRSRACSRRRATACSRSRCRRSNPANESASRSTTASGCARHVSTVELHAPITRPDSEITVTIWDGRELREIASPTHHVDVQRLSSGRYLVRARKAKAGRVGARPALPGRRQALDAGRLRPPRQGPGRLLHADARGARAARVGDDGQGRHAGDRSFGQHDRARRSGRRARRASTSSSACAPTIASTSCCSTTRSRSCSPSRSPVTEAIRAPGDRVPRDDGRRRRDRPRVGAGAGAARRRRSGDRPRVVLFFTDGQSDVPPVLAAMQADKRDVRVFTVGFGSDVNKAAARAPGRAVSAGVSRTSRRRRTSSGRCRCCTGRSTRPCWSTSRWRRRAAPCSRLYPPTLPDLFVDDELRISGRLRASGPACHVHDQGQAGRPRRGAIVKLGRGNGEIKRARGWRGSWAGARVDDLARRDRARRRPPRAAERGGRSRARLQLRHALHGVPRDPGQRARLAVGARARERARATRRRS